MITNLVAAVTIALATNVTERFPQELVPDNHIWSSNTIGYTVFYARWKDVDNPKEKWITTNVVEHHDITFNWDHGQCEEFYDKPVTNWSTHFEKQDGWNRSATNTPPPASWIESLH
jgi:hypothetical protein